VKGHKNTERLKIPFQKLPRDEADLSIVVFVDEHRSPISIDGCIKNKQTKYSWQPASFEMAINKLSVINKLPINN